MSAVLACASFASLGLLWGVLVVLNVQTARKWRGVARTWREVQKVWDEVAWKDCTQLLDPRPLWDWDAALDAWSRQAGDPR